MSDEPLLVLQGVSKVFSVPKVGSLRREPFVAVDRVDLEVRAGGSMAIVGESGSGKTTCARMIIGLETVTSGTIRVRNEDWLTGRRSPRERRRRAREMQMVFQDPSVSLDRRQSVGDALEETLRFHFKLSKPEVERRVNELLDQVGLAQRHGSSLPSHMSGGQRQRVAIARALAAEPSLLILDEAVSALDVSVQAQVLNLLNSIRQETGVAYLFISHDLAVVEQVCEDAVVMYRGKVVERGPVETILHAPSHAYTQSIIASVPRPGWKPRRRTVDTDVL